MASSRPATERPTNRSVSLFRTKFGAGSLTTAASAVAHMSIDQVRALAEEVIADDLDGGGVGFGQLASWHGTASLHASDVVTSRWQNNQVKLDTDLGRLLLYYGDVAVPDPLVAWAKKTLLNEFEIPMEALRHNLAQQLRTLAPAQSLLDSGQLVLFTPFDSLGIDRGRRAPRTVTHYSENPWLMHMLPEPSATVDSVALDWEDERVDPDETAQMRAARSLLGRDRRSVDPADSFDYTVEVDGRTLGQYTDLNYPEVFFTEPALRRFVVEGSARYLDGRVFDLDVTDPTQWPTIVSEAHRLMETWEVADLGHAAVDQLRADTGMTQEQLEEALAFSLFAAHSAVMPVFTGNSHIAEVLDAGLSRKPGAPPNAADNSFFLQLPDLTHVSFRDIVALRRDDELFEEVRQGLWDLRTFPTSAGPDRSREENDHLIQLAADEVLGPLKDRIATRAARRETFGTGVALFSEKAVNLGVTCAAGVLGAPLLTKVAGPAGEVTSKLVRRQFEVPALTAAASILSTIIPDEDPMWQTVTA